MKIITIAALAIGVAAFPANAQSLRSDSSANAGALAAAQSAAGSIASSQGGSNNLTFNNPANITSSGRVHNTYGTQTLRTAPQVVAPSMSSGHPCAWAPVSVALSVVGFGGAVGGQRIDDACLLAQMGVRDASISMIAARNPAACRALEAVGRIRAGSCGGTRRAAAPAQVAYARPQVRSTITQTGTANMAPRKVKYSDLKSGDLYQKNGVTYRKR